MLDCLYLWYSSRDIYYPINSGFDSEYTLLRFLNDCRMWNLIHPASWRQLGCYLIWNVAKSGIKSEFNVHKLCRANHVPSCTALYKLEAVIISVGYGSSEFNWYGFDFISIYRVFWRKVPIFREKVVCIKTRNKIPTKVSPEINIFWEISKCLSSLSSTMSSEKRFQYL